MHIGFVAAGDMVWHKIDDHFEVVRVAAGYKFPELLDTTGGIISVIWTYIEVVFDRIRAAGFSFENLGDVRWSARIISGAGLLDHTG